MNEDEMKDAREEQLGRDLRTDPPPELKDRMRRQLHGFREDLRQHPYVARMNRRAEGSQTNSRHLKAFNLRRLVFASAAGVGGLLLVLVFMSAGAPTWADVTERFKEVSFFSARIFIKEDALSEPRSYELWMGKGGRARMLVDDQVIFADDGDVTEVFDLREPIDQSVDENVHYILGKLGGLDSFSLDTVVRIFGRGLTDATPLVNADAVISRDMVVFDIATADSPEWLRIWALKESRLPVRIQVWDPRSGGRTDVILNYAKTQSDDFFDPAAFRAEFEKGGDSPERLAYYLLRDPGGRPITK